MNETAPVPSERERKSLGDIINAIQLIRGWVQQAGSVDVALYEDVLVSSAIERQLLIVSEAAIRIEHAAPGFCITNAPEIDWPGVRGIGNFIRHRYNDLNRTVLRDVVDIDLGPLLSVCQRLLAST